MGFLIETPYISIYPVDDDDFQFPSYGISHWNREKHELEMKKLEDFQFPSYGISHWNINFPPPTSPWSALSIPIIWDFSLKRPEWWELIDWNTTFNSHHMGFLIETSKDQDRPYNSKFFQFPSYGISHWNGRVGAIAGPLFGLSIPIIWDFSLKPASPSDPSTPSTLSIPIIWDFSLKRRF